MTIEETIAAAVRAQLQPVLDELRALRAELRPAAAVAELLTVDEVAARCKVTPETVRGWIHSKRLAAKRAGSRYLVAPAELERFLSALAVAEAPAVDSDEHLAVVVGRINRLGAK